MLYDATSEEESAVWLVREGEPATSGKGFRELKIYQLAHDLGVATHRLSLRLPKYEIYETGSQLRRAAKSVSVNIVEGYGRLCYKAEFLRFLVYAKASLDETEEHLLHVRDCYPEQTEAVALLASADHLGRRLYRFMDTVEAAHRA